MHKRRGLLTFEIRLIILVYDLWRIINLTFRTDTNRTQRESVIERRERASIEKVNETLEFLRDIEKARL